MFSQGFRNSADLSSSDCGSVAKTDLLDRARAVNRCTPNQLYNFPLKPFHECDIRVSAGRSVHAEQYGNPDGVPVIYIHGGLVMPLRPQSMGFLDPDRLRVISLHQRGAGKSVPIGDLREVSTQYSAEDVESTRQALGINSWHVYGHSFGSSIALLYSTRHAAKSRSLTIHGGFFPGKERTQAFYDSERHRNPDISRSRAARFDVASDRELFEQYAKEILADNGPDRNDLVRAFWGVSDTETISPRQLDYTRLMLWYRRNNYFLPDDWLEGIVDKLGEREVRVIHSVQDEIVPIDSSVALAARLPNAGLSLILGQHFYGTADAQLSLRRVCDRFSWD